MKRSALLMVVGALLACGGNSTGSIDKFDGAWVGDAIFAGPDTLHFVFNTRQTGSSFVGTGLITGPGFGQDISFTGTSTPPTMNATIQVESESANYIGTYVSSNRLEGFWVEGSESIPLNLARR